MAISSPGLGSGLDVTGIVSQLMAVERQPLARLDQQEARIQAEISAYGTLKGGLSSFQSSLDKLKETATFQATSSSSSDTDVLSVSSDTNAMTSSYSINVNRLAQQHKLGSAEVDSTTTFGGATGDELTLTQDSNSFTIDLSKGMTLSGIQAAINVDSNETGVTAGLITGDSGNQTLVLISGKSGYDNRVQLSFGGAINATTFNFSMLNRDADNNLLASENELNASLSVDGVTVTRGSNSISDVVEGLTLDINSLGQANVTIGQDSSVATQAVQGFVSAYNGLLGQLNSMAVNGSAIRSVESQLRGVLNRELSGLGDYSYISQLGVTTNAETGKLQLDSEQLTTALEENPNSVIDFFSDDSSGFVTNLNTLLEGFLQSGGTVDNIVNGAKNRIEGIERSRDAMERRMESIEQRYLKQFGALDTLMASMTTTSDYLTSQLDALSNLVSGNNK